MHLQEEYHQDSNSITHSPYYGCTVQVVSKAHISYEGILDGISVNKDRLYLKNVRVKGNIIDSTDRDNNSIEELDTINTIMIDHLTNDMHIYDEVCLNIRDVQELKLIRLPTTIHESKAKLHAIDPCLVDIRLSPSNGNEKMSNNSMRTSSHPTSINRRSRNGSIGSTGGTSGLFSCSSNESTSSIGYLPPDVFIDEGIDDLYDQQNQKLNQYSTKQQKSKPATLLAKKVLPKKIERNNFHGESRQTSETKFRSVNDNRDRTSPIRVTITSKLNPNATPFYASQRTTRSNHNSSLTFYERNVFQSLVQSQSMPNEVNRTNLSIHHHHHQQQQQQQNPHCSYQRFVPPRQMASKKVFNIQSSTPSYLTSFSDKQSYPQQQSKQKKTNHENMQNMTRQMSSSSNVMDEILSTPPIRERLSMPANNGTRRPPISLCATGSLPYQHGKSGDLNQLPTMVNFGEPIGSRRGPRTVSGTSSGSSLSVDIGPHSIVQLDSTSSALTSNEGQYDFEKANEEFRRYLALEELVTRRAVPSTNSTGTNSDNGSGQQQSQAHSYKKDISFFDRISCTATTGTAVAYTELDETEKNLETFGDDALFVGTN